MAGQDRDELTVGPRVNDGLVKCLNIAVMWRTPNVSTPLYALTSVTVIWGVHLTKISTLCNIISESPCICLYFVPMLCLALIDS